MKNAFSRKQSPGPSSLARLGWENHPSSVDFWETPWSLTWVHQMNPPMMYPTVLLKNYFDRSLTCSTAVRYSKKYCSSSIEPEPSLQKFCVLFLNRFTDLYYFWHQEHNLNPVTQNCSEYCFKTYICWKYMWFPSGYRRVWCWVHLLWKVVLFRRVSSSKQKAVVQSGRLGWQSCTVLQQFVLESCNLNGRKIIVSFNWFQ